LFQPRRQTGFIYRPDAMWFVVACPHAGIAGLQAHLGEVGALLGVLVSVTTIPAAGNLAVVLADGLSISPVRPHGRYLEQARTSLSQLLLHLAGLLIAGTLTLWVQRCQARRGARLSGRGTR